MSRLLSNEVIGIIACLIYLSIFLFSSWQLCLYCTPCRFTIFSTRKMFHVFLMLYCSLQISSLYSFCLGYYFVKWSFACHLFAICCEVVAVSFVAILWSKTLVSTNNAFRQVIPFLIIVDGFLVAFSIVACLDMESTPHSFESWTETSEIFKNLLLVEPIVLLINGLCLAYLGLKIRNRLVRDPSWDKLPLQQKRMVLFRLLGTMLVCCSCFGVRCAIELYLYINNNEYVINHAGWAASMWLPSLLPACILTYTMRRTQVDDSGDDVDDSNQDIKSPTWASSVAAAIARVVLPTSSVESQPYRQQPTHSNPDLLADSFDNVIAPLLATTLLAENGDDIEENERASLGSRPPTLQAIGSSGNTSGERLGVRSPLVSDAQIGSSQHPPVRYSSSHTTNSISGTHLHTLNTASSQSRQPQQQQLQHQQQPHHQAGGLAGTPSSVNIRGNVNLSQTTPSAAKSLVRTKSLVSDSDLSDS